MRRMPFVCPWLALGVILWGLGERPIQAQQPTAPSGRQATPAAAPAAKAAPAPAAARRPWPVRLKDGQPDVQGIWDPSAGPCGGTNFEPLKGAMNNPNRTSPGCVVDPPDGLIPYLPWARARRDEVKENHLKPNPAQVDTRTRGWPDGLPRQNYYHSFQILQPPGAVVILYEVQHEFRYIPLDDRPQPAGVALWMGSSRGHWEGNTLVVEVTNISDRTRMSIVGDFASKDLKLTEKWTFVDADNLEQTTTLTDPSVFSRPWTVARKIKREKDPSFEIMEYSGVEGDRDHNLMVDIPGSAQDQKKK
jgi:hypothetical protein